MFIEMPKKCPITGGMATGIKIDYPALLFILTKKSNAG